MAGEVGNQGTQGAASGTPVQTPVQGGSGSGQPSQSTVTDGSIEVGGERFPHVDALKGSYGELRKKFTQTTQEHAEYRKANEWLVGRLREIQVGSPEDWGTIKQILNGIKAGNPAAVKAGQQMVQNEQQQVQADPRVDQLEQSQRVQAAQLEIMNFQRGHADVDEAGLKDLISFVLQKDKEGFDYNLEYAYLIKNHKTLLAKGQEEAVKKAEDALRKGRGAASLGTGAPTAQPKKGKNFFKIKDENEATQHLLDIVDRHTGGKLED